MYRIIKVICSEGSRCKSGEGFIEETPVGWGIGCVGREVDGRGVDVRIGGDIRHRGQEVVHHARIVSVIDRRSDKARLEYITPEEASAKGHVVQVQESGAIREHWIDVDVLDVGQMRHRVLRQIQIPEVLDLTVVLVHLVHSHANLVEGVAGLPFVLTDHDNAQKVVQPGSDDDRHHRARKSNHFFLI